MVAGNPKIYAQLVTMLTPYTRVIKEEDATAPADAPATAPAAEATAAPAAPKKRGPVRLKKDQPGSDAPV